MLLSALSFSHCSPQKQLARTQERQHSNAQGQITADRDRTRDSTFFRELYEALRRQLAIEQTCNRTTAENVETVTREYDTSRPADTLTGKPPLLRETTQRRHRSDSVQDSSRLRQTETHDTHTAAEGSAHGQEQLRIRGETSRQATTETETQTENRRGLLWWQKSLCYVGLLTLIYLFYRFFKNK